MTAFRLRVATLSERIFYYVRLGKVFITEYLVLVRGGCQADGAFVLIGSEIGV